MLSLHRHGEERDLSVREFHFALAELGGFVKRSAGAFPGRMTLWRGWSRLHDMARGAELATGATRQAAPTVTASLREKVAQTSGVPPVSSCGHRRDACATKWQCPAQTAVLLRNSSDSAAANPALTSRLSSGPYLAEPAAIPRRTRWGRHRPAPMTGLAPSSTRTLQGMASEHRSESLPGGAVLDRPTAPLKPLFLSCRRGPTRRPAPPGTARPGRPPPPPRHRRQPRQADRRADRRLQRRHHARLGPQAHPAATCGRTSRKSRSSTTPARTIPTPWPSGTRR